MGVKIEESVPATMGLKMWKHELKQENSKEDQPPLDSPDEDEFEDLPELIDPAEESSLLKNIRNLLVDWTSYWGTRYLTPQGSTPSMEHQMYTDLATIENHVSDLLSRFDILSRQVAEYKDRLRGMLSEQVPMDNDLLRRRGNVTLTEEGVVTVGSGMPSPGREIV